jgi:hypothetical protein
LRWISGGGGTRETFEKDTPVEFRKDLIIRSLIDNLAERGVEFSYIPVFIRALAVTLATKPFMSVAEINWRMQLLGWGGLEVDASMIERLMILLIDSENSRPGPSAGLCIRFKTTGECPSLN